MAGAGVGAVLLLILLIVYLHRRRRRWYNRVGSHTTGAKRVQLASATGTAPDNVLTYPNPVFVGQVEQRPLGPGDDAYTYVEPGTSPTYDVVDDPRTGALGDDHYVDTSRMDNMASASMSTNADVAAQHSLALSSSGTAVPGVYASVEPPPDSSYAQLEEGHLLYGEALVSPDRAPGLSESTTSANDGYLIPSAASTPDYAVPGTLTESVYLQPVPREAQYANAVYEQSTVGALTPGAQLNSARDNTRESDSVHVGREGDEAEGEGEGEENQGTGVGGGDGNYAYMTPTQVRSMSVGNIDPLDVEPPDQIPRIVFAREDSLLDTSTAEA